MTPSFPLWELQFSPHDIQIVVDEAHARGLPITAHCHGVDGIEVAADAGVDSIEHCSFFNSEMVSAPTPALLEKLAAKRIGISATLGTTAPPQYPRAWADAVPTIRGAFGAIHDAGGVVVVGTDAGINPIKPHDVLPLAVQHLVDDVGMTPESALRAITSAAADVCHIPDAGRLRPGAAADMLAVDGDPTTDLGAMSAINAVWKSGRLIEGP